MFMYKTHHSCWEHIVINAEEKKAKYLASGKRTVYTALPRITVHKTNFNQLHTAICCLNLSSLKTPVTPIINTRNRKIQTLKNVLRIHKN